MKWIREIRSWIGSLAIAFLISLLIGTFIIQPTKVSGHSMDPTLHDQERVYISKLSHTLSYEPNYGDIVIIDSHVQEKHTLLDDLLLSPPLSFFASTDDHRVWIKRVIGKPGDVIEFKDHEVYRNGEPLDEPYLKEQMNGPNRKWVVPEGNIFVMGDNRNESNDSRVIGFIPLSHVLGKKL